MTCRELINNLQLSTGVKLRLKEYEKEFLLQRGIEEKLNDEEMEILKQGIANDMFNFDREIFTVYDLLTDKEYTLKELGEKYNMPPETLKYRIDNKLCINAHPYGFNKNEIPLNYRVNMAVLYYCPELNMSKPLSCWKKYFNDDKINIAALINRKAKYKKQYSFERRDIKFWEVMESWKDN